jgi:hypothetical protein
VIMLTDMLTCWWNTANPKGVALIYLLDETKKS